MVVVLGLFGTLACTRGTLTVPETGSSGDTSEPTLPTSFQALAEADGMAVSEGRFSFSEDADCCASGVSCLWNDPTVPYAVWSFPPVAGAADVPVLDGWSSLFRMRPDEALVWLGRTPPRAAYFSFRSFLQFRSERLPDADDFARTPVLGSLGPSLHQQALAYRTGQDPFDAPIALVTTADAALEARVVDWLTRTGWAPEQVQLDRIPPGVAQLGLGEDADLLAMVVRTGAFEDPDAAAAWAADPGATVLRLTPIEPRAVATPHVREALPVGGSGSDESGLAPDVDALGEAISGGFPDFVVFTRTSVPLLGETYDCIDAHNCYGQATDRFDARIPDFYLDEPGALVLAWGVNHVRTDKASYAEVAIHAVDHEIRLAAVDADRMAGSARAFVDRPGADDLYVVAVSRDCAQAQETLSEHAFGQVPCMEVPTGCPGVEQGHLMTLAWRAYLEPSTGAAPVPSELIPDRAVKLVPRPTLP